MIPLDRQRARADLAAIFRAALAGVDGRAVVRLHLETTVPHGTVAAVAVGKAAAAMLAGAHDVLGDRLSAALLITKPGHFDPELAADARITCLAGGHPLPDARSLAAGDGLLRFIAELPPQQPLLFLLSGGASSLVEVLPAGVDLALLQRTNRWLLGSGLDIRAMNRVRQRLSALKGGRLLQRLDAHATSVLLLSDVPGDDPAVIGSGPLWPDAAPDTPLPAVPDWLTLPRDLVPPCTAAPVPHHVLANLSQALQAGAAQAAALGYPATVMSRALSGPADAAARNIVAQLARAAPGCYLWGGETTVVLPQAAGRGGRNQHLALAAALAMQGRQDILLLAAGTDGDDGNTPAAGAIVDDATVGRAAAAGQDAVAALRRADAGTCLQASGDVLVTGPTGTNVTDLVIGLKLTA